MSTQPNTGVGTHQISQRKPKRVIRRGPTTYKNVEADASQPLFYPPRFHQITRRDPDDKRPFRFDSCEEEQVAQATDKCPRGTFVGFAVFNEDEGTTENREGITISNPYFLDGKIWVEIAGQPFPYDLEKIVVRDSFSIDEGDLE